MADDDKESEAAKDAGSEEGAEGAEGEGGSKKGLPIKKLLLIIVPVVLLLGGGAGAYFTGLLDGLLGKAPAAEGTEHAEGEEGEEGAEEHAVAEEGHGGGDGHAAAKKDDGHGGGDGHGAASGSGPYFLKIADEKGQDLVVNLNSGDGQMRFLQLGVQLELEKASDVDKVKAVMPRVIDQFQTYLRELRVKDLRGSAGIYRLQMELLARVNQAAAPVQVKDVLFEKILIQ
jgi:flagellar protein FliL